MPTALQNVNLANHKAFRQYVPKVYPGRAILFRAMTQPERFAGLRDLAWGDLFAEGLDIRDIPGHHATIYHPPHVTVLAETLRSCLDEALGTEPG